MGDVSVNPKSHLITACISCILSLVLYSTLRFYAEWFVSTQMSIILGGFMGSWLFLFSLTSLSNMEMVVFGDYFSAKLVPEILSCLVMAVVAVGVVHRVCATTCILFSLMGLYFVDRISQIHYNKLISSTESGHVRKGGSKRIK